MVSHKEMLSMKIIGEPSAKRVSIGQAAYSQKPESFVLGQSENGRIGKVCWLTQVKIIPMNVFNVFNVFATTDQSRSVSLNVIVEQSSAGPG